MGCGISMVRKCISYVPTHIVGQVAKPLILFHLDYCAPVWSSASKGQLKKLHTAQNRAARLVLHCPIRTNTISMHRQLSWLMVENRLVFNTTQFFRNTVFCSQPIFLYNQIVRCRQVHSHFTRSADDDQMMLPSPKSNALKRTVIYHAINHWNNCPLNIQYRPKVWTHLLIQRVFFIFMTMKIVDSH